MNALRQYSMTAVLVHQKGPRYGDECGSMSEVVS